MNAYTFQYDPNEFVPYSTGNLSTLVDNILDGNVVYVNGGYYATPEYVKSFVNRKYYYYGDDLNTAIYPQADRDAFFRDYVSGNSNNTQQMWVSGITNFGKVLVDEEEYSHAGFIEKTNIPGYIYVYGFYEEGVMGRNVTYVLDEMTSEFVNAENARGTFNGIQMKKENGSFFFDINDLKSKNLSPF